MPPTFGPAQPAIDARHARLVIVPKFLPFILGQERTPLNKQVAPTELDGSDSLDVVESPSQPQASCRSKVHHRLPTYIRVAWPAHTTFDDRDGGHRLHCRSARNFPASPPNCTPSAHGCGHGCGPSRADRSTWHPAAPAGPLPTPATPAPTGTTPTAGRPPRASSGAPPAAQPRSSAHEFLTGTDIDATIQHRYQHPISS